MNHQDHVRLIKDAIEYKKERWADLGSGDGAFTLALAQVTHPETVIYSVDQNQDRLVMQERYFKEQFPKMQVNFLAFDFTKDLGLRNLDGIIMANSLHYISLKKDFLTRLKKYVKPMGKLVLVEYNADYGNRWVPYPLSFSSSKKLLVECGFMPPHLLATIPSQFLDEIYACVTQSVVI